VRGQEEKRKALLLAEGKQGELRTETTGVQGKKNRAVPPFRKKKGGSSREKKRSENKKICQSRERENEIEKLFGKKPENRSNPYKGGRAILVCEIRGECKKPWAQPEKAIPSPAKRTIDHPS